MKIVRLLDTNTDAFGAGWYFRCEKSAWPYECKIEFMTRAEAGSPSGFAFMAASGAKSGYTLVHFPAEANNPEKNGISRAWLIDNWDKWVNPELALNEVWVYRNDIATDFKVLKPLNTLFS